MKNNEIMHKNERGTAIVIYNQWDLGDKYKVYTIRSGKKKYYLSFDNIISAIKYCDMIP